MALFSIFLKGLNGFTGRTRKARSRVYSVLNSTFKAAKPVAKKAFTTNALSVYAVKKNAFSKFLFTRAGKNFLTVEATTFRLGMGKYFPVRPNKKDTTGMRRQPISYAVYPNGWVYQQRGFMWKGILFYRKGSLSLPVKKQTGPSVYNMSTSGEVFGKSEREILEFCQTTIDNKLYRLL